MFPRATWDDGNKAANSLTDGHTGGGGDNWGSWGFVVRCDEPCHWQTCVHIQWWRVYTESGDVVTTCWVCCDDNPHQTRHGFMCWRNTRFTEMASSQLFILLSNIKRSFIYTWVSAKRLLDVKSHHPVGLWHKKGMQVHSPATPTQVDRTPQNSWHLF